jgi:site-specific recombinase XerD
MNVEQGSSKQEEEYYIEPMVKAFLLDCKARSLARGTIYFYETKLFLFVRHCAQNQLWKFTDLSTGDVRQFLADMHDKGHNKGGVWGIYRALKTFLFWWENEVEPPNWKNPIRKIKTPDIPKEILDPVEIDDLDDLLDVCQRGTFTGDRDRAIFMCLFDTGARAQEFLDIDLSDVRITTGEITIHSGKGGKTRQVYLGSKSRKSLRTYLKYRTDSQPALWVTDNQEDRLTYWGLRQILRRRSEKAMLTHELTLHSFRRGFALNMLRNGADIYAIQGLMGHETLTILSRYIKQTDADRAAAHRLGSPVDNK